MGGELAARESASPGLVHSPRGPPVLPPSLPPSRQPVRPLVAVISWLSSSGDTAKQGAVYLRSPLYSLHIPPSRALAPAKSAPARQRKGLQTCSQQQSVCPEVPGVQINGRLAVSQPCPDATRQTQHPLPPPLHHQHPPHCLPSAILSQHSVLCVVYCPSR